MNNINLLLGNNGSGKTALLKAISLAAFGPAVSSSGIFPYRLVRQLPVDNKDIAKISQSNQILESEAMLEAAFTPHEQDRVSRIKLIESKIKVVRMGDLEKLEWAHSEDKSWHPIYSEESDAFFFVGYGANLV